MKNIRIAFLIVLLLACKRNTKESTSYDFNLELINVPLTEMNQEYEFVKSAKYVFLDDQFLIGQIARILFFENQIFIHDSQSDCIIVFSILGEYRYHIDQKGKGPSEYLEITDFTIDRKNNNILIFDGKQHKLLTFSIVKNKFVDEHKVKFFPVAIASYYDCLFFYNPFTFVYPENNEYHFSLIKTSMNMEELNRYFAIEKTMGSFKSLPNKKGFYYGKELYFKNRFENVIYSCNEDSIVARYKIEFQNNEKYNDVLKKAIEKGKRGPDFYKECASNVMNFCADDHFITFQYVRNNKVFHTVYSKDEKKVIFNNSRITSITHGLVKKDIPLFTFPRFVNKNQFVSIIPFQNIINLKENEKLRRLIESMSDETLKENILDYNLNQNPVLCYYSFSYEN